MKLFFIFLFSFLLCSCKKTNEADKTITAFITAVYTDHNWTDAEEMVTAGSKNKINDLKYMDAFSAVATENKGGNTIGFHIVQTDHKAKSNDSAFYTIRFNDGSELEFLLLKIENTWKVDLNYGEEEMNTRSMTLLNDALETMRSLADSVYVDSSGL